MAQFLKAHAGRSAVAATPSAALYACTRGAADALGLGDQFGAIEVGRPLSYVEVDADRAALDAASDPDAAIRDGVLRTTREELAESRSLYDALATGNAGPDVVAAIERDVGRSVARLDNAVLSVTVAGVRL
jgi:cytosine/adenosine deaminase-related metal-dependent hydrolase